MERQTDRVKSINRYDLIYDLKFIKVKLCTVIWILEKAREINKTTDCQTNRIW